MSHAFPERFFHHQPKLSVNSGPWWYSQTLSHLVLEYKASKLRWNIFKLLLQKQQGCFLKKRKEKKKLQQRIKHFIQSFYPKSLLLGLRQTFWMLISVKSLFRIHENVELLWTSQFWESPHHSEPNQKWGHLSKWIEDVAFPNSKWQPTSKVSVNCWGANQQVSFFAEKPKNMIASYNT